VVNTAGESTRSNLERQLGGHRALVQWIGRLRRADQDGFEGGIEPLGLTAKART
jgi:hypothetical protein